MQECIEEKSQVGFSYSNDLSNVGNIFSIIKNSFSVENNCSLDALWILRDFARNANMKILRIIRNVI